jgi:hypothetical protein
MRSIAILGAFLAILGVVPRVFGDCTPGRSGITTLRAGLYEPTINECSWGASLNADWTIVDSSMCLVAGPNNLSGFNNFTGSTTFSGLSWNFPNANLTVDRIATRLGGPISGPNSVSIGNNSLAAFQTSGYVGRANVAVGPNALADFVAGGKPTLSQSGGNTAVGNSALGTSTDSENSAFGDFAGAGFTYGEHNQFFGNFSGVALNGNYFAQGENDTFIGLFSGPTSTSPYLSNSMAFGYASKVGESSALSLGCNATDCASGGYPTFKVGIGTDVPTEVLDVVGNIKIEGGGNGIRFADGSFQQTAGGGGGGGSSSLETLFGTARTSPTATLNGYSGDFIATVIGSTMSFSLNPKTTDFIQNTSALQSGSVFFVSSGTVNGPLSIYGNTLSSGVLTTQLLSQTGVFEDPANVIIKRTAGLNGCIRWTDGTNKDWQICNNTNDLEMGYGSNSGGMTDFLDLQTNGSFPLGSSVTIQGGAAFLANKVTDTGETINGPGNGNIQLTISGSTYTVTSTTNVGSANVTVGHLAVFSSTNATLTDGGAPSAGGGGTPASPNNSIQFNNAGAFGGNADFEHFASSVVYTNQFVDTGIQTSSFTYGVQASSLTLKTIGGFGGELDFWNSGANNDTIKFFNDSGAAQAFINENVGTWWRIDVDGGAAFIVQTADTNRLAIDAAGTVAVESGGLQLWSRTKAQIAVITPDSINSQVTGEEYYCSDCATVAVCISTGSAQGAFALITNKASACQ